MLERVAAIGKPMVLVLMNGSALSVNWADAHVPAIIEAWYPGGEGGAAVARLIAGDYSPAGRLPVTFYRSVDQLPDFEDYAMAHRTYRYFDGAPLYPFGHGLSYTSFRYANPRLSGARVRADGSVTASVDVANIGAMDGDEVVQLYASRPDVAGAPIRALVGFQRIHLARGETQRVRFTCATATSAWSIRKACGARCRASSICGSAAANPAARRPACRRGFGSSAPRPGPTDRVSDRSPGGRHSIDRPPSPRLRRAAFAPKLADGSPAEASAKWTGRHVPRTWLRNAGHCEPVHGRGDWIRTSDPHTPSVMRYQAALRPDQGAAFRRSAATAKGKARIEDSGQAAVLVSFRN